MSSRGNRYFKYFLVSSISFRRDKKYSGVFFDPPNDSSGKESACNAGDTGYSSLIPGLGRSPREANGNPFQYSCLKNPMDRGAWWSAVHRVTKSQVPLSVHIHTQTRLASS